MSRYQRTSRVARTAAVVLAGSACWSASGQQWLLAGVLAYVGAFCAWIGGSYAGLHRTELRRHDAARQASGAGGLQERPLSCCLFWRHSDGGVHEPRCPRLAYEQRVRDGRPLTEQEADTFEAIASHFDHGSRA
jgi:hypothetical protein